jgi:hypothetical protein
MVTRLAGEITALTRLRGYWGEIFLLPGLRSSAITALVWRAGDGLLGRLAAARRLDLAEYEGQLEPEQRRFASHGPLARYRGADQVYGDIAELWKESSLQMHRLARANKARYYHFLQPNQYMPDVKPMLEEERAVALRPDSAYGKSVARSYPLLREKGQELVREGVRFHDLTGIFGGIGKPLYIDDCCHVNAEGNAMIGRKIGGLIAEDFAAARRERERREEAERAIQPATGGAAAPAPVAPPVRPPAQAAPPPARPPAPDPETPSAPPRVPMDDLPPPTTG